MRESESRKKRRVGLTIGSRREDIDRAEILGARVPSGSEIRAFRSSPSFRLRKDLDSASAHSSHCVPVRASMSFLIQTVTPTFNLFTGNAHAQFLHDRAAIGHAILHRSTFCADHPVPSNSTTLRNGGTKVPITTGSARCPLKASTPRSFSQA